MFAWTVLTLVFVDELLAVLALGIWGTVTQGLAVGIGAAVVAVLAWALFASPKAPFGNRVTRPVVKVLVFTLASAGLGASGHPGWGAALFVFSAVINAVALAPSVQKQAADPAR